MQNCYILRLPDELLLQVFSHLVNLSTPKPWFIANAPYPVYPSSPNVHRSLRSYPYLGGVCRRWQTVLSSPHNQARMWPEVVVDIRQELITAIHAPLKYSVASPPDQEYDQAFAALTVSAQRVLGFIMERHTVVRKLVLVSTEGYVGNDFPVQDLRAKHTVKECSLGMMLGMLQGNLQELCLDMCSDLLNTPDGGAWMAMSMLPVLRVLSLRKVGVDLSQVPLHLLSRLRQLEALEVAVKPGLLEGIQQLPDAWAALSSLTRLQLTCHYRLASLPMWLTQLPHLIHMDLSACLNLNYAYGQVPFPNLTNLQTLVLQSLRLQSPLRAGEEAPPGAEPQQRLHPLPPLPCLTALSLHNNRLAELPAALSRLTSLVYLDLSCNRTLKVTLPLTQLTVLPRLAVVDLRVIHTEPTNTWSLDKCATMDHVSALARALKRRPYPTKVMVGDTTDVAIKVEEDD